MIKVSIIIPVYNVGNYIERCINSVLAQDYPFIECILVNDCSTDNSMGLINRLISAYTGKLEFVVLHHSINRGAAASRNSGISRSASDYIYFLDGDDEIYTDTISNLVKLVEQYPGLDLVQGEMYCEDPDLNSVLSIAGKQFPDYTSDPLWLKNHFLIDVPVSPCNKLINLEFLKQNKIYFKGGLLHEDILWRFSLGKFISSIAFTSKVGYKYNLNPNSVMTAADNDLKRINSQIWVIQYISTHLSKDFPYIENLSLLRQFHYAKMMKVLDKHVMYRDFLLERQIRHKLADTNVSVLFKVSYLILLSDRSFKYFSWLWNKNMGLLFRIARYKTRLAMKSPW